MEGLEVVNISKSFVDKKGHSKKIVDNLSFCLKPNSCISIVGESGSGKSTILKMALGLISFDKGKILLDGENIKNFSKKEWMNKRLFLQGVFQDTKGALNEYLSTYQNIEEALKNLTKYNSNERKNIILELMKELDIKLDLLDTPVKMLSGGEQRRISLIRALALKPKYLLLDEVVSGLDNVSCNRVLNTLEKYKDKFGCAYLFITHDFNSAYRLSDKIIKGESNEKNKFIMYSNYDYYISV